MQWNAKNHKQEGGKPIYFQNYKLLDHKYVTSEGDIQNY